MVTAGVLRNNFIIKLPIHPNVVEFISVLKVQASHYAVSVTLLKTDAGDSHPKRKLLYYCIRASIDK